MPYEYLGGCKADVNVQCETIAHMASVGDSLNSEGAEREPT